MDPEASVSNPLDLIGQTPQIQSLMTELRSGINWYWELAGDVLETCGVKLIPPKQSPFSVKDNFFSLLFLYSYFRAEVPPERRIIYAATLQCLRGMVTGCDNILDDEYKITIDSNIPSTGYRFRSVMDIMVSDRILFHVLMSAAENNGISNDQILAASTASMQSMTQSGIEEASEEGGVLETLEPEAVLNTIHHLKTGLLFQCPWDIPLCLENLSHSQVKPLLEGLYNIGIGCQVIDDMVDMAADLQDRRHNYLVSLVYHGSNPGEKVRLVELRALSEKSERTVRCAELFPEAFEHAAVISNKLLTTGLSQLFSPDHQALVTPAVSFLKDRVGMPGSARTSE